MTPDDELMELAFLGIYLVLAPAYTALCAVPLGVIYGLVAGLRSRRHALLLITIPALLAALVVTLLACGVPLRSFAAEEGLARNQLTPVLAGTLITFTVALVVWILPIGAAVSVSRVFATRGLKPTVVTLAAALFLAALVMVAFWAMFLLAGTSPFSSQQDLLNLIFPGIVVFGPTLALSCIFFGPIARFVGRNQPRPKEPDLLLPLDPLTDSDTAPARLSTNHRLVIASLATATVVLFGCIGLYSFTYFTDQPSPPLPSAHPLPPTWTPTRLPPTPQPRETAVALTPHPPTPTNTLVVPLTPAPTPRPCPPAPTVQMAPELLELLASVETAAERLMVQFLIGQYDSSLGLLEESPNVGAGRFFVHADAYLAGLDVSWYEGCYGLQPSPHWRVLRERVVLPEEEIMWDVRPLDLGDGVYSYQPDPHKVMHMDLWADRLLLSALSAKLGGNHAREQELVAQARDLWDGKCLQDEYYESHRLKYGYPACETFKTALYYHLTGDPDALAILRKMQETDPASPNHGGIYNMYDQNGDRFPPEHIDANSETTAVVLLCMRR